MRSKKLMACALVGIMQLNVLATEVPLWNEVMPINESIDEPALEATENTEETNEIEETEENQEDTESSKEEEVVVPVDTDRKTMVLNAASNTLLVDGIPVVLSSPVLLKDNLTYVPMRTIVRDIYGGALAFDSKTGKATATIEDLNLEVKTNSKQGVKNGNSVTLEYPLIVEKGTLYIPTKALTTLFDMELSYNPETKDVTISAPTNYSLTSANVIADFMFLEDTFIQGQEVTIADNSFDLEGKRIVAYKWVLDGNTNKATADINALFTKVTAGVHNVSLRVKNEDGKWSEWTQQQILILANEAPTIKKVVGGKSAYAQGEKMEFSYTYDNETWEEIVEEKWTYKKVGEPDYDRVPVKPEYFFAEGEYEVTLQLKDAYGNWSETYTAIIKITSKVLDTELNYKFNNALPGTIIDNYQRRNYRDLEEFEVTPSDRVEGAYILSNSPENINQNGILYEEYLNGTGKLNFYHTNRYENPAGKKLVIAVENVTEEPVTFQVTKEVIKGPVEDSLYLGQILLYDYFRNETNRKYTINPGETIFVVNTEDKNWHKEMVISGKLDVVSSGNVKITFAAMDKGMTPAQLEGMPYLETEVHPRGTFTTTDLIYDITPETKKETYFVLGKGAEEWCEGVDAITGEVVYNKGNYGVIYHLNITAEEDMGIILNPRGGPFRGVIRINGAAVHPIPRNSYFGTDSTKAAILTTIRKGQTVRIEYALPNGSASPILFGIIPKSFWK